VEQINIKLMSSSSSSKLASDTSSAEACVFWRLQCLFWLEDNQPSAAAFHKENQISEGASAA